MTEMIRVSPGWKPLSLDLSAEVSVWATELRALFAATGLSINRFVLMYPHIDKGTVSRYLNGKRVPRDRWFLDTLMAVQEDAGRPLTQDARDHLTALQLRALEVAHPHEHRVRKVTDELEIAVTSRWEAERYARGVEEQLAERIRQVHELIADKERLRAAWDDDRARREAQHRRLDREIAELTEQLALARDRAVQAEYRCRRLEEVLHDLGADDASQYEIGEPTIDTATRVLALAQQTADLALEDGRREADETLSRARREAEEIILAARAQAAAIAGGQPSGGGNGPAALIAR